MILLHPLKHSMVRLLNKAYYTQKKYVTHLYRLSLSTYFFFYSTKTKITKCSMCFIAKLFSNFFCWIAKLLSKWFLLFVLENFNELRMELDARANKKQNAKIFYSLLAPITKFYHFEMTSILKTFWKQLSYLIMWRVRQH